MASPYRIYMVHMQVTTETRVDEHAVAVYARDDAEASGFATDEVSTQYRGREVEMNVVEIIPQRNRL